MASTASTVCGNFPTLASTAGWVSAIKSTLSSMVSASPPSGDMSLHLSPSITSGTSLRVSVCSRSTAACSEDCTLQFLDAVWNRAANPAEKFSDLLRRIKRAHTHLPTKQALQ